MKTQKLVEGLLLLAINLVTIKRTLTAQQLVVVVVFTIVAVPGHWRRPWVDRRGSASVDAFALSCGLAVDRNDRVGLGGRGRHGTTRRVGLCHARAWAWTVRCKGSARCGLAEGGEYKSHGRARALALETHTFWLYYYCFQNDATNWLRAHARPSPHAPSL